MFKPSHEVVSDSTLGRQKVKNAKQIVSIKHKNEHAHKVFKVIPYQYKSETSENQTREVKKIQAKTERHTFKLSNDMMNKDGDFYISKEGSTNTLKWTLKSRDTERGSSKNKNIEDFERLFYQTMNNERGKVISHKGVDFNHLKTFKVHNPNHYRSLSKHKNTKHVKNKKSFRA